MNSAPEEDIGSTSRPADVSLEDMERRMDFFHEVHAMRIAIFVIAAGVAVAILNYASTILIPIVLAVFLSYVLSPFVNLLMKVRLPGTQLRMPRGLAALIVVLAMAGVTGVIGMFIGDQVRRLALELPLYEDRITENVSMLRDNLLAIQERFEGILEPIRRYPEEGEEDLLDTAEGRESAERVQVFLEQGSSNEFWHAASTYIAGGITGILGFLAQALMCMFVLIFILTQAPNMRVKLINILGRDVDQRQLVLNVLQNVNTDIQRYLFNRFATNTVVAITVGLAFYVYGLKYAFLLGILAGLFNFIPYVGPIIGTTFPALIAYMQFGDLKSVFVCVFIYGCITGIEGNLITPVIIGRHLKLNSLAVLLALIFWGWMWGAIGLLLAIPILAGLKAISEHVDAMRPLNELLRG
jgi:predicted PurR-regulated permease PerM